MAAIDNYAGHATGLESPVSHVAAVTPADGTDLAYVTRGIIVGVSGDVAVVTAAGNSVTLPALMAGIIHPFRVSRILATGTTATSIKAVW